MRCSKTVLAAAASVGRTWVVSPDPVEGRDWIPDPGGGQGAAVEAALREIGPGPVLVVNSDLPSVTADDLRALTTRYRSAASRSPRPETARRTRSVSRTRASSRRSTGRAAPRASARTPSTAVEVDRPGLRDDVDTPADLVTS